MSTAFSRNIGSGETAVTFTSLNSLANSATVGAQAAAITLVDGNNNVPFAVDFELTVTGATGTIANDKAVYLFLARSIGGTNFEVGPPAIANSDSGFTFTSAPSTLPTSMLQLGAITFNAASTLYRCTFTLWDPPAKIIPVVLNYTGIALAASGNALTYRMRFGDGR